MPDTTPTPVVTVFLRNRGEVLLLRRSENVGSYQNQWGAVAGHVENDDPQASALNEIEEETGLSDTEVTQVRQGPSFTVRDDDQNTHWKVHPFLFDASTRSIEPNWETEEAEWVAPTAMLRRETVPKLWTSYRRVAPSIVTLTDDTTHGSAYLSLRALEVIRDRAGLLATTDTSSIEDARGRLVETVQRVLAARPSMAALVNRIHRVMHASRPELSPATVEVNAHEAIDQALRADVEAAQRAADQVAGKHVLTLSRSGTVLAALQQADPAPTVTIAVSSPGREGVDVAEELASKGLDVTLLPDAAISKRLAKGPIDLVLVGADTVLSTGAVVNKVGTRGLALAAIREEVPFSVACASDKFSVDEEHSGERAAPRTVYQGSAELDVWPPRFDTTPAELVTGRLITERGSLSSKEIDPLIEELSRLRAWM